MSVEANASSVLIRWEPSFCNANACSQEHFRAVISDYSSHAVNLHWDTIYLSVSEKKKSFSIHAVCCTGQKGRFHNEIYSFQKATPTLKAVLKESLLPQLIELVAAYSMPRFELASDALWARHFDPTLKKAHKQTGQAIIEELR